ncbi:zinc finger protein 184-like [Topomyia yanbarensis]|uniref:zinc finger protein 184-like n=1 Tax=Topomyia yanbarensis TaxID=2498891 RepID=UPI00273BBFF3|nr:zinc finger protein 184-like [Topomyia yanbarensis]
MFISIIYFVVYLRKGMESLNLLSCRMCLSIPDEKALTFSVFDTFKNRLIQDIIYELFSIKITKEDRLLTICLECVNCINTVQKIHQQFAESNQKLKSLLGFTEDINEVELLIIDDNDQVLQNTISPKGSDLELEVLSLTAETEVTSSEDVDNIKLISIEEHARLEAVEVNRSDDVKNDSVEEEITSYVWKTNDGLDSEKQIPRKRIKEEVTKRIPLHKCYLCLTSFDSEMAFTEHLHVHFGEVPITCDKCDNLVLKSVRQASKHLALHDEDDRPHKCRICELRFFTRENSLTHERKIHRMKVKLQQNIDGYADRRKLKKYQCSYCGQLAPTSDCLRKHELLHGSQVFHTCEICPKRFTARKNLTRHMMIHTGELPYKCDFCDRAFRQAGDLKDHIRGHTKENPYICTVCDACFRNGKTLLVHQKKLHPESLKR